jgi:hypothetical protein
MCLCATDPFTTDPFMKAVNYSDSTPAVSYGYDRLGRQIAVTNGATLCNYAYNDANQVLTESYSGGPLNGLNVTNGYDNLQRRTGLAAQQSSNPLIQQSFGYVKGSVPKKHICA